MRFWLTVLVVTALLGLAFRIGRGPERFAAGLLVANLFLSLVNASMIHTVDFEWTSFNLTLIDTVTLFGLIWIALRANRVWPLTVAALQMLVVFAHLSMLIYAGWSQGYWGFMIICQYLEVAVIYIGTLVHFRRERRVGRYRSWRLEAHAASLSGASGQLA